MTRNDLYRDLHAAGAALAERVSPRIVNLANPEAIEHYLQQELRRMLHEIATGDPLTRAAALGLRPDVATRRCLTVNHMTNLFCPRSNRRVRYFTSNRRR